MDVFSTDAYRTPGATSDRNWIGTGCRGCRQRWQCGEGEMGEGWMNGELLRLLTIGSLGHVVVQRRSWSRVLAWRRPSCNLPQH